MSEITGKAYGKINLNLDVTGKREDGYHLVRMVMQTVDICDTVTITETEGNEIELTTDSGKIPSGPENLVWRAADVMRREYGLTGGLRIHLDKRIPIAAGMAGGSADAAATIHAMDALFSLGLSLEEKQKIGVKLGADIPYCLMGGTALSEGIGEILTKLPDVPKAKLVIAKPDLDVSTKFVYENLHADSLQYHPDIDGMVASIEKGDLCGITDRMGNVLETVTCKHYPVIEQMKGILKEHGAVNALMSGSGPTVFGIFTDDQNAKEAYEAMQEAGLARQLFLTGFADGRGRED